MNSRKTAFRDVWNLINFKAFQMTRSVSKMSLTATNSDREKGFFEEGFRKHCGNSS